VSIPADHARFYPESYYSFRAPAGRSAAVRQWLRQIRDRYAVSGNGWLGRHLYARHPYPELRSLSKEPNLHPGTRILDVGSGAGALLLSLHALGFRNLSGVEPYLKQDVDLPDGVRIERNTLANLCGEWDLIMFHHSFEHLPDPSDALQEACRRLADGGWILIRTPVVPSHALVEYGEHWVGWDAPRHLFIPSIRGMELLAAGAHVRLANVQHDSTELQFWASEQYRRDVPLFSEHSFAVDPARSGFSRQDVRRFRDRSVELNKLQQGDQAAFYLTR
jgi:SAM-dependent methyltransferase